MTESQTSLTAEELQPGHLYRVEFDDYYTTGHFVGVFLQVIDPQRGYDFAVFDCGQIGLAHPWQLTITEILPGDPDDDDAAYPALSYRCCEHTNRQHHSGGCMACSCSMPPA